MAEIVCGQSSLPGLTRQSISFDLVIPGCALLGADPESSAMRCFWIPGSLALLAPRNDGFRMDARAFAAGRAA
jgi:hypothetical protein